ncbi:murein biosynthesis integral membrane protein MurJ [Desulfopila aestuarii]|uniref:Probable lipid II flippase MurJ n=1 Tax=Desulfopila aestuarii DSM 18488 TaxID=1121416 RepID=A0A1M7Y203_9BACT|nr:murein biosynthesis integral membrane protein MurJ [Desulfopila aestuarii]SHO45863.1 putative peptidoglycan lipid II flippase [Desulfopila aestuarii DSM 18488]
MKQSSGNSTTIARSAGVVSIAVMCSRVLGLIREQVFATLFGAGFAYDAFVVAFRIPNLLRDLFGEGALSAAFVTVFSDYDTNRTKEETWRLASNVLTFFAIALSLISILGIYLSEPLVHLLAPDYDLIPGKTALTVTLTRIMLPFLVAISLSAVVMGMLNTKGRFFVPAIASSFFNLGSIVAGTGLAFLLPRYGQPAIAGMAIGTLVGGILQLGIQLPTLRKVGFSYRIRFDLRDSGLIRILKLMIPATIGLSATQINIFINTNFAASCVEGSVSWLNYAFRLVQLPIGIFGVALSIAMMPLLARQAAEKNVSEMRATLVSSLVMVLALTIPATAGLMLLAEPIIRLIFEHGAFTAADTRATAQALSLYSVGLFAYSSNKVLVPAFYALNKTRYPVIASFIAIATNLIFINLTIDRFQHMAIALSTSLTMLLNFLFLTTILSLKMDGLPFGYLTRGCLKITFATATMSALVYAGNSLAASWMTGNLLQQGISLFTIILLAGITYIVLLNAMRLSELSEVLAKIGSRLKR